MRLSVHMLTHICILAPVFAFSLCRQYICLHVSFRCVHRLVILPRCPTIKAATPLSLICATPEIPRSEEHFPHACSCFCTQWENVLLNQFRIGGKKKICHAVSLSKYSIFLICRTAVPVCASRKQF